MNDGSTVGFLEGWSVVGFKVDGIDEGDEDGRDVVSKVGSVDGSEDGVDEDGVDEGRLDTSIDGS